jgi:hypothetical protein
MIAEAQVRETDSSDSRTETAGVSVVVYEVDGY